MIYTPSMQMNFGMHKGYELSKIYQYDPSYLEWAVKYIPTFEIEPIEFEKLPKPTPYEKDFKTRQIDDETHTYNIESVIPKAEMFVLEGYSINEIDFQFSEFTKEVLIQKKQGIYSSPHYKKDTFSFINIDDLFPD